MSIYVAKIKRVCSTCDLSVCFRDKIDETRGENSVEREGAVSVWTGRGRGERERERQKKRRKKKEMRRRRRRRKKEKKRITRPNSANAHFARNNLLAVRFIPLRSSNPHHRGVGSHNPDVSYPTAPSTATTAAATTIVYSTPLLCLLQCIPGVSHCKVNKLLPDKK